MAPSHDDLATVLSEFARTLVTDFPIQGILDHLVSRIVDIMPIDAAGVSLISPTQRPRLVSGSTESAMSYELLQTTLEEGPCLAVYDSGSAISIPDLAEDSRFPRFAQSALAEGVAAVFTFPLRAEDRCLGALDLYRRTPGALDADHMVSAQTLADVATAYLLNSEARSAKGDFVAAVSHELRTPLTSIIGYLELLEDEDSGSLNSTQATFLDAASRNSDRLMALAGDLLTVASLEAGVHHEHVRLDLGTVLREARAALDPVLKDRRIQVTFEIPAEPVMVPGDAANLVALVTNLVGNAVKFTEDDGWVRCTLRAAEGRARIDVSDNGLGIPRAEQRDLFTRFFRSSTAQEREIQGTGLGLTIVEAIVHGHGGDISVVSEHLAGSTFTVLLPMTPVPAQRRSEGGEPRGVAAFGTGAGHVPPRGGGTLPTPRSS